MKEKVSICKKYLNSFDLLRRNIWILLIQFVIIFEIVRLS
jgi:hypothetical protein